jgi:hypothetical protein
VRAPLLALVLACAHARPLAPPTSRPEPASEPAAPDPLDAQRRACDLGDVETCRAIASRDPEVSEKLCHGPSAQAGDCDAAGNAVWTGKGKDDDAHALADLVRGCTLGGDCAAAALAAEETGDVARAVSIDEQGCLGANDMTACYQLERVLADARALPSDKDVARLDADCAKGTAASCTALGVAYEYARGVAGSEAKAIALYGQACDAKDATGCYRLGALRGDAAALRSTAGAAFLSPSSDDAAQKACEKGKDALACHFADTLTNAYAKRACELDAAIDCGTAGDQIVDKDAKKAIALYERGCKAGDLGACAGLRYRVDAMRALVLQRQIDDGGGVPVNRLAVGAFRQTPPFENELPRPTTIPSFKITIGDAKVTGDLDKDTIRRYVTQQLPRIEACYATQLGARPKLVGTLVMAFTILPEGIVGATSVVTSLDPGMESCVIAQLRQIQFPKPKGGGFVNVTAFPITFSD